MVPRLGTYLWNAFLLAAPAAAGIVFARHESPLIALGAASFVAVLALLPWLGLLVASKCPSELRRKLTQPVG